MIKKIILAALWLPLLALAQSYPSPTFNNLTVNGTFTATGKVGLASLAAQAANTVVANVTGSSASPTAFAMPSCSTSTSALNWTTSTGFTCNTAVNAATLGGATFAAPGPIGSTTPGTGSFTTLAASSTVSGTGFSTYLASPPAIGGTTAAAGKFTTLQATSTITPSSTAGIVGTVTNDNANAGSFGEYQTTNTLATSLTNATPANATSISLTAGDWDVTGVYRFNTTTATFASGAGGISTTSVTFGGIGTLTNIVNPAATSTTNQFVGTTGPVRISLASTTTVYLVVSSGFAAGSVTADGFIRARRVR
jgi:hypothetical protein